MSPSHTRKRQKLYRYYVSQSVIRGAADPTLVSRIPAGDVEAAVIAQLRILVRSPEVMVATWRAARNELPGLTEAVRDALHRFDDLWDELFPAEQTRIVRLLVDRVDVGTAGADIRLKVDGLGSLLTELRAGDQREAA
jgi:site-specific DNA recombinase